MIKNIYFFALALMCITISSSYGDSIVKNNNNEDIKLIKLTTNKGNIVIKLFEEEAPETVKNFLSYTNNGSFNGTIFHRVIENFMIQGGDFENNDGTGGYAYQWYGYCNGEAMEQASDCSSETLYTLPDEANNNLTHLPCILSMAKTSAPHTGGSQFFIIPEDSTPYWLDGVHTVFGKVISGCEHVTTLSEVATDGNDRPVVPVIIVSATASE